jgi:hypothetical protein
MMFESDLLIYTLQDGNSNTSKCEEYTNCNDCVGTLSNSNDCVWCTSSALCLDDNSPDCKSSDLKDSCESTYYITIFIVVVASIIFLCCAACLIRRLRRDNGALYVPLMSTDNSFIFRNSLKNLGEEEWMCSICGYDNRPRIQYCDMCGTSYEFNAEYKSEKGSKKKRRKDITIPSESQISPQKSGLSFSGLSAEERQKALNYRRLNQLSLRQKAARRRRMWRREVDQETGDLVWRRVNFKEGMKPITEILPGIDEEDQRSNITPIKDQGSSGGFFSTIQSRLRGLSYQSSAGASERVDSFDAVLNSMSPGYTSYLDGSGNMLWEKVDTSMNSQLSQRPTSQYDSSLSKITKESLEESPSFGYSSSRPSVSVNKATWGADTPLLPTYATSAINAFLPLDLQSVVILPYREKLSWFLNMIASLQRPWTEGHVRLEIRREMLLEDSSAQILSLSAESPDLHRFMRVHFIGEAGIDAGGIEREWFQLTTMKLFDQLTGLFTCNIGSTGTAGTYHINPLSNMGMTDHLLAFQFAGRFLGKGIMGQQHLPALLSIPLRKQILAIPVTFSDLEFVDVELYRNLIWLRDTPNEIEPLGLVFAVDYQYGEHSSTFELKPNGSNIAVTDDNINEYLDLRLRHRLLDSIKPQLEHFLKGLYEIIPPTLLSVFDYQELELLSCGIPTIDIDDWIRHAEYMGEYHRLGPKHKVIRWFWEVVKSFTDEERVRLLQFTTGCSRLPAQGFKALQSNDGNYRKFNVQSIRKTVSMGVHKR